MEDGQKVGGVGIDSGLTGVFAAKEDPDLRYRLEDKLSYV
jgi:hypothetical protein